MARTLDSRERARTTAAARWQLSVRTGSGTGLKRGCVLVVDDEADGRDALEILLTWAAHEVHVASDGAEALIAAARYLPELIFLDIGMPRLGGYDVCHQLRTSPEFIHARIFALSGFSGPLHEERCAEAGFTGQLTKPLDPALLQRLIRDTVAVSGVAPFSAAAANSPADR